MPSVDTVLGTKFRCIVFWDPLGPIPLVLKFFCLFDCVLWFEEDLFIEKIAAWEFDILLEPIILLYYLPFASFV
jgi:hypothetical protein